ncbi:hypothetical protein FB567DRAFT_472760 [Paraphoma chrysanthemicola]|uniref:NAD(P)-binding protein n=1 Tax=Paraphoma chrysanthemicola TaxID=798071 RepID=A0A8K0VWS4_9PLEO|nr:hypothetical protein FB567DRAFT_472760 [Paraphoma chrysanthemicola]
MSSVHTTFSFYSSLIRSLATLVFARLYTPQPHPTRNLTNQTAIVTGANSGIGLAIATQLARQGATVYLACRSISRGEKAIDSIVAELSKHHGEKVRNRLHCWELDTSSLPSVRAFCSKWKTQGPGSNTKIDILIHNAGIASPPTNAPAQSPDGIDLVYVTNFLGSFLMTHLLEPCLSSDARVVLTSSTGHYSASTLLAAPISPPIKSGTETGIAAYIKNKLNLKTSAPAYVHSKAQQVLFALALQRYFDGVPGNQRTAHAFTPGFTSTPIFAKFECTWRTWLSNPLFAVLKTTEGWIGVSSEQGGMTGAWLGKKRGESNGGGFWEWGVRRTSLVDYMRVQVGEEVFWQRVRGIWNAWEKDADVVWNVGI